MKKLFFAVLSLLLPAAQAESATFTDKDSVFTVNMPAGWTQSSSDNPAVSLRLENGSSSIEFEKQEDFLSDYYLKSGVNESVEAVKARGASFFGAEINVVSIYGITNAYYTAYEAGGARECMALFSYNDNSFSMSAVNVSPELCKDTISSVCKPGTKCVPPCSPYNCLAPNFCKAGKCVEPPPCSPENCLAPKMCRNNRCVNPPCSPENCPAPKQCIKGRCMLPKADNEQPEDKMTFDSVQAEDGTPQDGETASDDTVSSALSDGAEAASNAISQVVGNVSKASKKTAVLPKHLRKPLPIAIWAALIALWFIGGVVSRGSARLYKNPKIPPPPPAEELPPDFFFPFVISTMRTITRVQYNINSRTKQRLYATYDYKYVPLLIWPIVAVIAFHVVWSVFGMIGKNEMFIATICKLPFGSYIATFPEAIFILLFIIGLVQYFRRSKEIAIFDSRQTLMMRAVKEGFDYCIIYDGNGKEVAKLKKTNNSPREWQFVDAENNIKFLLKDDAPKLYAARKLFGYQGGLLRSRYGIFQKFEGEERRAGYTLMVPTSADQFQIHLDFAFAFIAHPAQMLAAILFVISYEKDSWYPTIL